MKTAGVAGSFWCYPAVAAMFAVLPTAAAGISSAALLMWTAWALQRAAGTDVALQFVGTLTMEVIVLTTILQAVAAMRQTLGEQAITDPLTGAFNRRHLDACLAVAVQRRGRTGEPASLLLLDVDHFKSINDTFGHAAGDEVLTGIVKLLRQRLRPLDGVFRVGGEEFAVLLADAGYRDALAVAEALRQLVAQSALLAGHRVSVSVGVSEYNPGLSFQGWLADADAAVYRAKHDGRNRVAGRTHMAQPTSRAGHL
jgi:diguanylate cyclase (GGDEF)-like protein